MSATADRLPFTGDDAADRYLVEEPLALLIGFALDQQVTVPTAFAGPQKLKERIGGPFGHLDNRDSERMLASLDRSRLKHVIAAHLSQQNNRPELACAALARAMGCEASWIGLATQDEGFGWRDA